METVFDTIIRALLAIVAIIALTRLQGLRSFSKLSSFDFSLTVAFGSFIAGFALAPDTEIAVGLAGIATVFAAQGLIASARRRWEGTRRLTDNEPLLLMRNGEWDEEALSKARMTRADLLAKLREANVLAFSQVHAVVMETTGDVSVLHGTGDEDTDIDRMLEGVRRA